MKRIVVTLLVVIVVLVAVDFAAAATAEYQVSNRMQQELALPEQPSVRITGFPFLTQALAGDYRKVELEADRLRVGDLREVGIRADLYHVRVPFTDIVTADIETLRVDEALVTVRITEDDLARQIPGVTKLSVLPVDAATLDQIRQKSDQPTFDSSLAGLDPDSAVELVATTSLLGMELDVSVIAVLRLAGEQIQIVPRDIRLGSGDDATRLPRAVQSGLSSLFTVRIDPGALPFTITPTTLKAVERAVEVSGTASNLVFRGRGSDGFRADR